MNSKILLSGSTGLVGSTLVNYFTAKKHDVWRLVRHEPGENELFWDPAREKLDPTAIENFDCVIHLSGENISRRRWSKAVKAEIISSRIDSTALLASALGGLKHKPKLFACASATGYYGDRDSEELTEESAAGNTFLSDVVINWENAASPAVTAGIRTVFLRFGVILSTANGALKKMLPLFKSGLGGRLGSGKQYMPWISIREIPRIVDFTLANTALDGPVNVVAPQPATNTEFTRTLAEVLQRPAFFHVPALALKLMMGEMAQELLLSSSRVVPQKLINSTYPFHQSDLKEALHNLI